MADDGLDAPVRALDQVDLAGCLELALNGGWGAEEAKWRFLLEVGPAFGVEDPGRRAGWGGGRHHI